MSALGSSPQPVCLCGHTFHRGPCVGEPVDEYDVWLCHCPDGELDGDR